MVEETDMSPSILGGKKTLLHYGFPVFRPHLQMVTPHFYPVGHTHLAVKSSASPRTASHTGSDLGTVAETKQIDMVVSSNKGTPIAGWFVSFKKENENG